MSEMLKLSKGVVAIFSEILKVEHQKWDSSSCRNMIEMLKFEKKKVGIVLKYE